MVNIQAFSSNAPDRQDGVILALVLIGNLLGELKRKKILRAEDTVAFLENTAVELDKGHTATGTRGAKFIRSVMLMEK